MTLTVQHVPQQYAAQTWPLVEKFIASAEKFGGDDYSLEQIKMYVTLGHWTLLVATDEDKQIYTGAVKRQVGDQAPYKTKVVAVPNIKVR